MLLLKLLQSFVKALNSQGTPRQVAAGIALGAALGLTPIASLHNVVIVLAAMLLNVSLAGFSLGWALFVPVGFILDPLFDAVGRALLGATALRGLWTALFDLPVVPWSRLNNSVVLGSLVVWAVAFAPLYLVGTWAVAKYRERVYQRLKRMRFFQALSASSLVNVYRWFQP
jgi:uncharacterized protein (TIGR03546 family)